MPIRSISRWHRPGTEAIPQRNSMYNKTDNVTSSKTISTDKVYPGGVAGYSLTGSGVVLGEWDAGGVRTTHQSFEDGCLTAVARTISTPRMWPNDDRRRRVPAARGMSYGAQLRAFDWNSDIAEMASEAAAGLRTSNHSYGLITGWHYDYFNDNRWAWWQSHYQRGRGLPFWIVRPWRRRTGTRSRTRRPIISSSSLP